MHFLLVISVSFRQFILEGVKVIGEFRDVLAFPLLCMVVSSSHITLGDLGVTGFLATELLKVIPSTHSAEVLVFLHPVVHELSAQVHCS